MTASRAPEAVRPATGREVVRARGPIRERRGAATERARMEVLPDFTPKTMTALASANIEPGTTIINNRMTGFDGLTAAGATEGGRDPT